MRRGLQVVILLKNTATGILAPVLTLALLRHGASIGTLSLMIGAYSLTVIVMEFPSGLFADLYGRKTAFLVACACGVLSYGLLLLAHSPVLLLAGMAVSGLSRAFASGSLDALAMDAAPDGIAIARVSARLAMLESAGLAVGALGGGLLAGIGTAYEANLCLNLLIYASLIPLTALAVQEARKPVVIAATAAAGGASTPAAQCCAEALSPARQAGDITQGCEAAKPLTRQAVATSSAVQTPPPRNLHGFLRQAKRSLAFVAHSAMARALFLLAFVTGTALAAVETYWQPALEALAPAPWLLGAFSFLGFCAVMLASVWAERRMIRRPQTGLGFVLGHKALMAACVGLLAASRGTGAFLGAYLGAYLFLGAGGIAETTLLNREAPSTERAGILSLFSFTLQAGGLLSALLGYLISARGDFRLTWVVGAALLLGALAWLTLRRQVAAGCERLSQRG